MSFGTQLRQARKRRRLTQKALADAIGVKHNSVSNWESDRNRPDPETIRALCALLEVQGAACCQTVFSATSCPIRVTGGILREESLAVLRRYFRDHGKG